MNLKEKKQPKYSLFSWKALALLIIPIIIENTLSTSLGLVDSFMTQSIGESGVAMSAVTNVDQISNLLIQLFAAFGAGGAIITSQRLGAGKVEEANHSARQLMMLMFLASIVVMTLCLSLNNQIVRLFFDSPNEEYLGYAYSYFYIMAASFPFLALFNASAAVLRAQRKSMFTMMSGAISFCINVALNALFIYYCQWGVMGAALATLISRVFSSVFLICILSRKVNVVRVQIFKKFRFNGGLIKNIVHLALPSGIENCLFQLGKLMTVSFLTIGVYWIAVDGTLINYQNTANSIAMQINNLASMVGGGVNTGIITVIGQAVGTGDIKQVKYYMKRMLAVSYMLNTICTGIIWGMSPLLIMAFSNNIPAEALAITQNCLHIALSVQFVTYPLSFGLPAMLKATSDVRYVMVAAVSSMIVMRVGLCYLMTCEWVGLQLGAIGFWIGMVSDWGMRSLLFGGRILSGRWKKSSGLLNGESAVADTPNQLE